MKIEVEKNSNMSQKLTTQQIITYILAVGTVLFSVFELAVSAGAITVPQATGFLSNLTDGGTQWYLNPIPWVLALVVLVNLFGFAENYSVDPQQWNIKMFAATWFKYVPIFVLFSQVPWAYLVPNLPANLVNSTNLGITGAITIAIDIITRALKSINTTTTTNTQLAPTPSKP